MTINHLDAWLEIRNLKDELAKEKEKTRKLEFLLRMEKNMHEETARLLEEVCRS